jgi:hypothetical protein
MKKSVAIILVIVAVLLCTCPLLVTGVSTFVASGTPEGIEQAVANAEQVTGVEIAPADIGAAVSGAQALAGCGLCLGVLIPVAVGLITFRMARKQNLQ